MEKKANARLSPPILKKGKGGTEKIHVTDNTDVYIYVSFGFFLIPLSFITVSFHRNIFVKMCEYFRFF